ncbi:MAG: ribonuclease R [Alphaproteobacteria bacterium]|nr:ribonuclease R [Alphaproteobacteria bacterium]
MAKPRLPAPLPSKEEVVRFIRESPVPVGKREIARHFRLGPGDRVALKGMLKYIEREGTVERGRNRRLAKPGSLPEVAVVEVTGTDADGEVLARPIARRDDEPAPTIYLAPERPGTPALGVGARVLARLKRIGAGAYEARIIRQIGGAPNRVLGVYDIGEQGGRLRPTDRRHRTEYAIARVDADGARPGELVLAEVLPAVRLGLRQARVVERLGNMGEPRAVSLIAIHSHDIPTEFSAEALELAERAKPVGPEGRTDLRDLPLVTIDGEDARDFDDAVWAERDTSSDNPSGWHLVVAIADVAHYVRPGDALDRSALRRGNSVYFPDRVVPMLPEALSNELCSLRPGQDRACLAVHIWIDADGRIRRHRFVRGLMRSTARLTYDQVQLARDGQSDAVTRPLMDKIIEPLYGAFAALDRARRERGTLELEMVERRVLLDRNGRVRAIEPRQRHDSHRLIEEFMIAANVAAAETLEARHQPCMYRVHDQPDPAKVEALREFLASLGYKLARGQVLRPVHFTQMVAKSRGTPHEAMVSELVLRTQAQAVYSPDNLGHFGLALTRYAHFTSPIRRYADVLVHRALIGALRLGPDGLPSGDGARFVELGQHISMTERRAAAAERDAVDRYTAAFLSDKIGQIFSGRINGVTRFGLFVKLEGSGADGLVPVRTLPFDAYFHDESRHALVGRRHKASYTIGDRVEVRLAEADPITGGLVLHLFEGKAGESPPRPPRGDRNRASRSGPASPERKGNRPDPRRRKRRRS